MSALAIEGLTVRYDGRAAVADVSLLVAPGEIVALVGPSGSGKSTLAAAALGLLPATAQVEGHVSVDDQDLIALDARALRAMRGGRVGAVFQDPATALNPALTIGLQIGEVLQAHAGLDRRAAAVEADRLLAAVGLDVGRDRYPHTLSGGQRQRVCIAMAIAAGPALLIADEPTAALDPEARAGIVGLLVGLVRQRAMGLLLISHDELLVAQVSDRVVRLEDGRVLAAPPTPILGAGPPPPVPARADAQPLLRVRGVSRSYPASSALFERRRVPVLDGISFDLAHGETLAVLGPSGSGKSTLMRAVLGLDRPELGEILVDGEAWRGGSARRLRRHVQAVLQDPADSLDPTWDVGRIVAEPLHLLASPLPPGERRERAGEALWQVGLDPAMVARRPAELSGGQRQRVALARALIPGPRLVVLDEALSALDPGLRAEMAALLLRLQRELRLSYLFVSHDRHLVRALAHRVIVLRAGRIVVAGEAAPLLDALDDAEAAALPGRQEAFSR